MRAAPPPLIELANNEDIAQNRYSNWLDSKTKSLTLPALYRQNATKIRLFTSRRAIDTN